MRAEDVWTDHAMHHDGTVTMESTSEILAVWDAIRPGNQRNLWESTMINLLTLSSRKLLDEKHLTRNFFRGVSSFRFDAAEEVYSSAFGVPSRGALIGHLAISRPAALDTFASYRAPQPKADKETVTPRAATTCAAKTFQPKTVTTLFLKTCLPLDNIPA